MPATWTRSPACGWCSGCSGDGHATGAEALLLHLQPRVRPQAGGTAVVAFEETRPGLGQAQQAQGRAGWGRIDDQHVVFAFIVVALHPHQPKDFIHAGQNSQFFGLHAFETARLQHLSDVALDPRFAINASRVKNREQLHRLIQGGISQVDSGELVSRCNALKIPVGVIQNVQEVFEMEEAKSILMHSDKCMGVRSYIGKSNAKLPGVSHILPPPAFGQHTHRILHEKLAFSTEKLTLLQKSGVIN